MTEQYDSDSEFETKIDSLVKLMRESKHCVIYTGAGISTAANIPDYRGKNGVWTSLEQSFHDFNILTATRTPDGEIKNSGKSIFEVRIPNFCYIQVIVFDLSYLPVAAVGT